MRELTVFTNRIIFDHLNLIEIHSVHSIHPRSLGNLPKTIIGQSHININIIKQDRTLIYIYTGYIYIFLFFLGASRKTAHAILVPMTFHIYIYIM